MLPPVVNQDYLLEHLLPEFWSADSQGLLFLCDVLLVNSAKLTVKQICKLFCIGF